MSSAAILQLDLTDVIREQLFPTSVSEWLRRAADELELEIFRISWLAACKDTSQQDPRPKGAPPTSPSTVTTLAPTRTALVSTVTEIYAIDATLVLFPLRRTRGGPKKQNSRTKDYTTTFSTDAVLSMRLKMPAMTLPGPSS